MSAMGKRRWVQFPAKAALARQMGRKPVLQKLRADVGQRRPPGTLVLWLVFSASRAAQAMAILRGLAASAFGSVTVRTPFS